MTPEPEAVSEREVYAVPFGWEVERYVDDLGPPLCEWQRNMILRQWPHPRDADPSGRSEQP